MGGISISAILLVFPAWAGAGRQQSEVQLPHCKTMMLTPGFSAISQRELQGQEWGTMLKKEREGKKQTLTACGLKIQRKESKKPVQQLIEFSM